MKWWYVPVLIVGMAIGWWLLGKLQTKRTAPLTTGGSVERLAGSLPTQMTYNLNHQTVQTSEATGTVQKWDPNSGTIEFVRDNVKLTAVIDPEVTVIYTPSLKVKDKEIKITAKDSSEWPTAFCPGDLVTLRLTDSQVILADNGGDRSCGNKDE